MSSSRITPKATPDSPRTAVLAETRDGLRTASSAQLGKATDAASATSDAALMAAIQGTDALSHVVAAGADAADILKNATEGALLATAGALVRVAEEVGDLLGNGLQRLGRALIAVGNLLRKFAGGAQIVVSDLKGSATGQSLSDKLHGKSADAFARAAASLDSGLNNLVAAGGDMKGASQSLLAAAQGLAVTAAHLGTASALAAAAVAVDAARVAVDATERGLDGAGALLQGAGRAVIDAGNAVNTAAGTDTAVEPR